jgi:hypothetical protein
MSDVPARVRHRWFIWVNFRPHRWNAPPCRHQAIYWNPDARCTGCGHRTVTCHGDPPGQTRALPAILWPFEIGGRAEARLRGYLARKGRL